MIDLVVDDRITVTRAACDLIERALETALRHAHNNGSLCVLLTSEEEIQRLNREFRSIDRVTDVLSFPAWEGETPDAPMDGYLGDIAICMARAEEQAALYGHAVEREMAFLAVHGALHLMGYDHIKEQDEAVMRREQADIMEEMGLTVE